MPTVLTIAGSDPSGGAGIQADLRTFELLGVSGLSAITAITAQTKDSVFNVNPVAADILTQQLAAVSKEETIDSVKIGMIGSAANVRAIILFLRSIKVPHIVIDPVFVSTSGYPLLETHAMRIFKEELLPLATVITPNLDEAATLTGMRVWNIGTMKEAARQIHVEAIQMRHNKSQALSILIKGGHLNGNPTDILYDGTNYTEFTAARVVGSRHGTGCALSSAIAVELAKGRPLTEAVTLAKKFVEEYIRS